MKILMVYADHKHELNSSIWRMLWPAQALQRAGHKVQLIHRDQWLPDTPFNFQLGYQSDIIIVERVLREAMATRLAFWRREGKRVVLDLDDAYEHMPEYLPSYKTWHTGVNDFPPLIKELKSQVGELDMLTVTCPQLAEDWRTFVPKVAVVPNYPDLTNPNWTKPYPVKIRGVIGWGGGASHFHSFTDSDILPALAKERTMIVCGDVNLRALMPKAIHRPYLPFEEWPYVLGQFSVGIAPLAGEYDRRRSWIKCVEYGLKGIPWVASNIGPYDDCKGGILVRNKDRHWTGAFKALANDPSTYEALSKEGLEWAWKQGIDDHIQERVALYESLIRG